MALLAHNSHPLVIKAQVLTSSWYATQPSIRQHDQDIAELLTTYLLDVEPELITAALIAHSPSLAPGGTHIDQVLSSHLGQRVRHIVTGFANEYRALTSFSGPALGVYVRALIHSNPEAAQISAADKTLILTKLRDHDYQTDLGAQAAPVLAALKHYCGFFTYHAASHLPEPLTIHLTDLITDIPA